MKTLQNDLTTPEQSKRLIELGVPKNSANYYYGKGGKLRHIDGKIPYSLLWEVGCTPCWSVGRLMEIWEIITEEKWLPETEQPIIEELISNFSYYSYDNDGPLDFSKLEE